MILNRFNLADLEVRQLISVGSPARASDTKVLAVMINRAGAAVYEHERHDTR